MGFEYGSANSDLSRDFSRRFFAAGCLGSTVMPLLGPENSPGGSPECSEV